MVPAASIVRVPSSRRDRSRLAVGAAGALCLAAASHAAAGAFATSVVSYDAGVGAASGFDNPANAIGSPTRVTGFDLRVTPFNPPFQTSDIVSIGKGGHLTLAFETPVTDDASNLFGVDLILFGNSFFYSDDFSPVAQNLWRPGGTIELSSDGVDWTLVPGTDADGLFPTLGFTDTTDPFGADGGSTPTDFQIPVDPAFSPWGKTFDQIKAGYGLSGGGTPVDFSTLGINNVRFVRISNPVDAPYAIEVDAIADAIPAPSAALLIGAASISIGVGSRRRTR